MRHLTGLAAAFFLGAAPVAHADDRPNVILIAIDDLRIDLGSYGHPSAVTPALDAFAASGLLFERAYTQQAVCAPSRAALMTGLRPETTGIDSLKEPISETVPDVVTLPMAFKQAGYTTVQVGKIYHHKTDDPAAWSKPAFSMMQDIRKARRKQEGGRNSLARVENAGELPDAQNLVRAIGELREVAAADAPFFLAFGVHKPHLPFFAPAFAWDLYGEGDVPDPVSRAAQENAPDRAVVAYEVWGYKDTPDRKTGKASGMPEAKADELRHGYLAAVSFADGVVGSFLQEVDALGLAEDTIVVIWSDHGFKLGDYGGWAKHSTVEKDIRIPMMIRVPGVTTPGERTDALVETVDVYPTLAELAGIAAPGDLEGLAMTPLLTRPDRVWKQAAFSQYPRGGDKNRIMGETVRTDRYRYTAWVRERDGEVMDIELYDHAEDPNELVNVATKARYAEVVEEHEAIREAGPSAVRDGVRR